MMRGLFKRLRRDRRGATLVEFAMVAPTLLVVIMGLLDMSYRLYAKAMLEGSVQKAARDSTLEAGASAAANAALDKVVIDNFKEVNGTVTDGNFVFRRRNFADFTKAGKMEQSTGPGGRCAPPVGGVPFTWFDENNNNVVDDGGVGGQGGANDAVLYTVSVNYRAIFPVQALFGASPTQTITATTVLRNQPYNSQQARAPGTTRNCP